MKILMVCLGNICRSPLAEGIMRDLAGQEDNRIRVASAGTAGYHIGEEPDPRSMKIARKRGIDISRQRAAQISYEDIRRYDKIFAMDKSNLNDILALCKKEEEKAKVELILNYHDDENLQEVPDPYYGGSKGFEQVYDMLDVACNNFLKSL